ncbi:MAG: hypothetical protein ACREC6_02000 [Hyphomicrobiaceae bacterium]
MFLGNCEKISAIRNQLLSLLEDLLKRHANAPLTDFTIAAVKRLTLPPARPKTRKKPVRKDLVAAYYRRLENAVGDHPDFMAVFSRLQTDPEMRSAEMIMLAERFAFVSARSREPALKKIFMRHQVVLTTRARSAATAGRIAG